MQASTFLCLGEETHMDKQRLKRQQLQVASISDSLSKVTLNSQCFINRYDAICIGAEAGQAVEFFTEAEAYQFSVMQLFSKPIGLLLHMDPYGTYHNRFEAEGQFERLETGLKMIVMTMLWLYHWHNGMKTAKMDTNGTNEGRVLAPSCPCQRGIRICARLSGRNTCVMCSVCSIEARTGMLPSGSWCTASHKLLKGFAVSQCLSENAVIWKVFTCSSICTNQYAV